MKILFEIDESKTELSLQSDIDMTDASGLADFVTLVTMSIIKICQETQYLDVTDFTDTLKMFGDKKLKM